MEDGYFRRSVIMVYNVNKESEEVLGLRINISLDKSYAMNRLFHEFANQTNYDIPLSSGGPVAHDELIILHTFSNISDAVMVSPNLWLGGSIEQIKLQLLKNPRSLTQVRFFLGHCIWSISQLLEEANEEQSWIVCKQTPLSPKQILNPTRNLWKDTLAMMNGKYATFAKFPTNPHWN